MRAGASPPRTGCASWAKRYGVSLAILRVPGIYAETRLPLERIRHGTPVLTPDDDVFTNHIHADDLARATIAALFRAKPNRAYNVTDDAEMKMGGWFDAVADAFQLPRPPRVSWEEAERRIAPMLLSFMSESRRLRNDRMKRELRVRLRYPTPQQLLDEVAPRDLKKQCRWTLTDACTDARRSGSAPSRWPAIAARLDAYERLVRLDKPIGILLLLWPTLSALWTRGCRAAAAASRADLHDGHDADALGRLRGQRLGRPAIRRARAAHGGAPARDRRDRAVGGARCSAAVLAFVAFLLVLATNTTTIAAVAARSRDRVRLSVLQALLRAAAGVSRHRVLVRHSDGVRRDVRRRAAARLVAAACSTCSG